MKQLRCRWDSDGWENASQRNRFKHQQWRNRLPIALLVGVIMILGACSSSDQSAASKLEPVSDSGGDVVAVSTGQNTLASIDELPDGLGRGLPSVSLAEIANAGTGLNPGDIAPNFALVLADGRQTSLHDLRGRPVMINFWATWCGPCRLEMPDIVAQANRNEELMVLAVNVMEDIDQIMPFVEEFQMTMPVPRDADGAMRKAYSVRNMPTSYFIDREGKITNVWQGILTKKQLTTFTEVLE